MVKRLVDIDDELLANAKEVLGLETMKDTVNAALEEVVRQRRLRAWIDWMIDHAPEFRDEELQKGLHPQLPIPADE